jgi:hypothetical protein
LLATFLFSLNDRRNQVQFIKSSRPQLFPSQALTGSPPISQIDVPSGQALDPEPFVGWIAIVFPQVLGQMTFSATDPVRALTRDTSSASQGDFDDDFSIDFNRDLHLVSMRITNDELVLAGRRGRRPVEFTCADNAEAVFRDQFDRPATRNGTVNFQVFFLDRHLTM